MMNSAIGENNPSQIRQARLERAQLIVSLEAIRNNYRTLANTYQAGIMPVIKGDAYGLGALPIAQMLQQEGACFFAVDNVAEGIGLREAGISCPVLVIDGDTPANAPLAIRKRLTPGIHDKNQLMAYEDAAAAAGVSHKIWLVANVGFNRSGYKDTAEFLSFVEAAAQCAHLDIEGVYAHLSNATDNHVCNEQQIADYFSRYEKACSLLGKKVESSLFASHGMPRWAQQHPTTWLRPGLLLYGEDLFDPGIDTMHFPAMQPAITLKTRIVGIQRIMHDDHIGYGRITTVNKGQVLANLALGFGSGLPRGDAPVAVLVNGHKTQTIGARGMDAHMIDITKIPGVKTGDWVSIIGSDGGHTLSARHLAAACGLSTYELLSNLNIEKIHTI